MAVNLRGSTGCVTQGADTLTCGMNLIIEGKSSVERDTTLVGINDTACRPDENLQQRWWDVNTTCSDYYHIWTYRALVGREHNMRVMPEHVQRGAQRPSFGRHRSGI
jgi:hypothetical protein